MNNLAFAAYDQDQDQAQPYQAATSSPPDKLGNDKLRLSGFTNESVVDGPGIRVVVFVQGCDNACENCHNPESWDISGGDEHTVRDVIKMVKTATGASRRRKFHMVKGSDASSKIRGVTFSGGEPFLQAGALVKIANAAKRMGLDITVYTGYTYEELCTRPDEDIQTLLALADYLIDGPYIHKMRDIGLKFRGSTNQRVIDMNETRSAGRVIQFI